MHFSGNCPSSVSRPSSSPSAPSSTMLATSVASARVGRGAKHIESIRRVTMQGLPIFSHVRSTCFCTANIFSGAISAPSSPRARSTTSAASMKRGRSRSACRLSTCATTCASGSPCASRSASRRRVSASALGTPRTETKSHPPNRANRASTAASDALNANGRAFDVSR